MTTTLSAVDGTMDALVQAASIPSLGSLIKSAKAQGYIKPQQQYHASSN